METSLYEDNIQDSNESFDLDRFKKDFLIVVRMIIILGQKYKNIKQ